MTARVSPHESPPLGLIAPFFLVAPAGLAVAGLLLAGSNHQAFLAINLPRTVAVVHATVLGWITLTIMGALYQMGPVVMGGQLWSLRLARIQFVLHVLSVAGFIAALDRWSVGWMSTAGVGIVTSLALFAANVGVAAWRAKTWTIPRATVFIALGWLLVTASVGITYAGTLQHLWFPVTMGRLSMHAHLGLVGWLAIMVMGLSYQLVPMFNVITKVKPRFGVASLAVTSAALAIFALAIAQDPPAAVRVAAGAGLVIGPALWAFDLARLLHGRSKRRMDVQGHATFVSIGFLALTAVIGLVAATGTPWTDDAEPARWLLAYGACGLGGWVGTTLIGNSFKILPFLIWLHRYRPRVGIAPVPVVADIYNDRFANAVLAIHSLAVLGIAASAVAGSIDGLRLAGVVLAVSSVLHCGALSHMFLPKKSSRAQTASTRKAVTAS